jgi:hypothetical protein
MFPGPTAPKDIAAAISVCIPTNTLISKYAAAVRICIYVVTNIRILKYLLHYNYTDEVLIIYYFKF